MRSEDDRDVLLVDDAVDGVINLTSGTALRAWLEY